MSSEQNPARRRMAGYTPPAAQPAAPATEHEAPALAVSAPEATAPETPVPEQPEQVSAAQTPTSAEQAEPASAAPANRPEQTPEPAVMDAPARKRRMGGAPAALPPTGQPTTPAPAPAAAAPATTAAEPSSTVEPSSMVEPSDQKGDTPGSSPADSMQSAPASSTPTRKRRMGSAPAPAAAAAPTAPIDQDASPTGQETSATQPAAGEPTASPATPAASTARTISTAPAAPSAGAPKRRMGSAPAAQATTPSAPAPEAPATGTGEAAPPKKRMGGAPAPAKTRMGGAPASGRAASTAAATASAGSATPTAASAAPAASTTAPAASSTATTGAAAPTASVTRPSSGRAGTPGPAGAATRKKAARPWVKPALIIGGLVIVAVAVVLGARWLRTLEGVQEFIATYDGHSTQLEAAPEGMPWWMGWQHFFNMFLIVLIIRTGLQVRNERKPPGYWTAKKGSFFSPKGNTPKKVSLTQWLHQSLDVLWVLNGLVFIILLFVTGHWMRIVPTDWDVFPNMLSGAIQYASLDWPTENGWVHYNALQTVAYGFTVFIAAPLAILSGIRFSTWWPDNAEKLNKIYPVEWARATHFPVMLYFVGFIIVHVFLVFFTGALANLNHMYTSRDVVDWWGLVIFLVSLVVIAAAWFLTKPMFTTPIAARMGKVSK
ncbi:cytochrome b/b6 domain-containing protein [Citricoccus nitrophenolicus]